MGEYAEAETLTVESLESKRRVLGPEHATTLVSLNNLALVYKRSGRLNRAEVVHREEWELSKRVMGESHPEVLVSMLNLARVLIELNRSDEAEALLSDAITKAGVTLTENHPLRASLHQARGDSFVAVKNLDSAKADYEKARGIWIKIVGSTNERVEVLNAKIEKIDSVCVSC